MYFGIQGVKHITLIHIQIMAKNNRDSYIFLSSNIKYTVNHASKKQTNKRNPSNFKSMGPLTDLKNIENNRTDCKFAVAA